MAKRKKKKNLNTPNIPYFTAVNLYIPRHSLFSSYFYATPPAPHCSPRARAHTHTILFARLTKGCIYVNLYTFNIKLEIKTNEPGLNTWSGRHLFVTPRVRAFSPNHLHPFYTGSFARRALFRTHFSLSVRPPSPLLYFAPPFYCCCRAVFLSFNNARELEGAKTQTSA